MLLRLEDQSPPRGVIFGRIGLGADTELPPLVLTREEGRVPAVDGALEFDLRVASAVVVSAC